MDEPPDETVTRPRARQLGLTFGGFDTGPLNAITDVARVVVGHVTLRDDEAGVHSGVTAISHPLLTAGTALPAGLFVGNGYGKLVGATQVMELGRLETPVLLTSTLSTFRAADALVTWVLENHPGPPTSINPVVGEINDAWLSSTDPRPVTPEHVHTALRLASPGPVPMGNVGGGAGACALGFKAGIGSASRVLPGTADGPAGGSADGTVGVLVQANMGGTLRLAGRLVSPQDLGLRPAGPVTPEAGSCVVLAAVDFPCVPGDLTRMARRLVFALGRVGARFSHGSGDYGLAFSVAPGLPAEPLSPAALDRVFEALMDSVEEAVVDALLAADTVRTDDGRVAHALPAAAVGEAVGEAAGTAPDADGGTRRGS
ncbi:P1 family peptidase [Intrasporangium sp. DVR]|uniref:P1 family peptidase n=1 Tax=Intrasporangium sp. DVR TaxID=3127867 RepID=UPI00313A7190